MYLKQFEDDFFNIYDDSRDIKELPQKKLKGGWKCGYRVKITTQGNGYFNTFEKWIKDKYVLIDQQLNNFRVFMIKTDNPNKGCKELYFDTFEDCLHEAGEFFK